jgi:hypothetical protein
MRKFFVVAICVLTASAGCHMCDSPYDYCSPVVESYGPGAGSAEGPEYGPDYAANNGNGGPQMAAAGQRMAPQGSQGNMR